MIQMKANCGDDLKKMRGWDRPEDGDETKANCEDHFLKGTCLRQA